MKAENFDTIKVSFRLAMALMILFLIFTQSACNKNQEAEFTADFLVSYLDDNHVQVNNESSGEYYSLIWDFGNGESDTTTDKKKKYTIYYPEAGNYKISLRLTGYTGGSQTSSQTVTIEITDLLVSFTAEVDPENPNYVNLKNTTEGEYDAFRWLYGNTVVENETEIQAYFPLAGNHEIELQIIKSNKTFSDEQTVYISQDDPGYTGLIWSDEFDYNGLPNPAMWNMETGGGGWGNNELQYYTNSENNAQVGNGILTITAREESVGGREYTSARITTKNKFDFKYGRIEARIKLPYGKGMWPAFWLLGKNFDSAGWPACGEIDIMEMVGGTNGDNTVHATLHWDNAGQHASYGEGYSLSSGIFADDYHIFSVQWNNQEIVAYVDGTKYYNIDITPGQLSEFHNNFFVILNMAVGGDWPGSPNANTTFPQTMEIDYVRVYRD